MTAKVLLVEDDAVTRFRIRDFLEHHDFDVVEAETCEAAGRVFVTDRPDVSVLDFQLPDGTALDLLPTLKNFDPQAPAVILTGHGSIDLAVRAIQDGADHFFTKPVELPALLVTLQRLVEHRRTWQKQQAGEARLRRARVDPFMGVSAAITGLAEDARRVVASDSPIMILGETGTGEGRARRVAARQQSPRG